MPSKTTAFHLLNGTLGFLTPKIALNPVVGREIPEVAQNTCLRSIPQENLNISRKRLI